MNKKKAPAAKGSQKETLPAFWCLFNRRAGTSRPLATKVLHYSARSAGNTIENVFAKDPLSFINSKQQGPRA